jgi:hypothetical protein
MLGQHTSYRLISSISSSIACSARTAAASCPCSALESADQRRCMEGMDGVQEGVRCAPVVFELSVISSWKYCQCYLNPNAEAASCSTFEVELFGAWRKFQAARPPCVLPIQHLSSLRFTRQSVSNSTYEQERPRHQVH